MLKPRPPSPETSEKRSPFWWFRWVPAVVVIVLLLDALYVVGTLALVPVLASFALAYLLNLIVYHIEKRGLSRPVAALVALLIVTFVTLGYLIFIIPGLWEQSIAVGKNLMEISRRRMPGGSDPGFGGIRPRSTGWRATAFSDLCLAQRARRGSSAIGTRQHRVWARMLVDCRV
jgi:hypothetical protein